MLPTSWKLSWQAMRRTHYGHSIAGGWQQQVPIAIDEIEVFAVTVPAYHLYEWSREKVAAAEAAAEAAAAAARGVDVKEVSEEEEKPKQKKEKKGEKAPPEHLFM